MRHLFIRSRTLLAGLILFFPHAALGQSDGVSPLRDMLARVPATLLTSDRGYIEVDFGNPEASVALEDMRRAAGETASVPPFDVVRGMPQALGNAVMISGSGTVEESASGLVPSDHGPAIVLRDPPRELMILDLPREAIGRTVARTLEIEGAQQVRRNGAEVVFTPGDDFSISQEAFQPGYPFGGHLGMTRRFLLQPDYLAYSPAWPAIDAMISGGESLADSPPVQAFLAALDPDEFGALRTVSGFAAEPGLGAELGEVIAPGLSLTIVGAWVADMGTPTHDIGALVMVFAPGTDVASVAERLRTNLETGNSPAAGRPFSEILSGVWEVTSTDGANPVVVMHLTAPLEQGSNVRNIPATRLYDAIVVRDLSALLAP